MSTKERLKEYISYQGINVSSFEKMINTSNGYVNSISKGIGSDKLEIILENFPNLNIEWLLTGKGNMLKEEIIEVNVLKEPKEEYGLKYKEMYLNYKEMYLDAKYTIEVQKKYIESLEQQLNTKRKAG